MKKLLSISALMAVLLPLGAALARAQCPDLPPNCTIIAQCQEITQPGLYEIDGDNQLNGGHLTFSGAECITVSAPNVKLVLFHPSIDGGGHGIGVHVLKSASGFELTGDTGGVFANLSVGVMDDADGAQINPGNYDEPLAFANTVIGILLNAVHGVTLGVGSDFGFSMTGYRTAVMIQGGGGNSSGPWMDIASHIPGFSGLDGPGGVGIDIEHSRDNLIEGPYVVGGSGVVIGPGSRNNTVDSGFFKGGAVGVEAKRGAKRNSITNNFALSNQTDLRDDNQNCGSDIWSGNTFNTAVPSSCVH